MITEEGGATPAGIQIEGAKFIQIMDCLIYNEDGLDGTGNSSVFSGTPKDVFLFNAEGFLIKNNIFHQSAHANRVGVWVDDEGVDSALSGHVGIISDNIFNGRFAKAIFLDTGTRDVTGDGNLYPGPIAIEVDDDGTGNSVS